jgi:hypothetical protein
MAHLAPGSDSECQGYRVKVHVEIRAYRCGDRWLFLLQISELDIGGLNFFAELSSYHVYTTLNAKNQFRAPTEWGICLRPSGVDSEDETPELKCISCDSERVRSCWLTAMRLAKVNLFFFFFLN